MKKTETTETMEKEVLGDLMEKKLQNRIKHNYYKTLHSVGFGVDTTHMKDRIKEDFKKQNIKISEDEIDNRIRVVLHQHRYELLEYMF